jgi:hypothetical protein
MHTGDDSDARETHCQADHAKAARPLTRLKPERQKRNEDRHGRVRHCGDAGVDVRLAPGDQQKRERHPDHPDKRTRRECRSQGAQPALGNDDSDEHGRGAEQAKLDERGRGEVPHPDLDEHVRGPQIADSTSSGGRYERLNGRSSRPTRCARARIRSAPRRRPRPRPSGPIARGRPASRARRRRRSRS